MNPFPESQTASGAPLARSPKISVATVFIVCAFLGLGIVGWRTVARVSVKKENAKLAAAARGIVMEFQFNRATAAAETLAALAGQGGGAIPNFQKLAGDWLQSHPGLATLELQPSGVVREVFPKTGHERTLGVNVLTDPIQRSGANAAVQKRALTATGPMTLDTGETGLVVRAPVFVRGRDGREMFWGFTAASMRLAEALARARLDDLWTEGYQYVFYAPGSSQQGVNLAAHGRLSLADAVKYPVTAQDVEFRLAVVPRGGWVDKTKLAIELMAVFFGSGLLCLFIHVVRSRREVEAALADQTRRLDRETSDREQAREDCLAAKRELATSHTELVQARSALEVSKSTIAKSQARLEAALRAANEIAQVAQANSSQGESRASELQCRLDASSLAASEAAQAARAEIARQEEVNRQAQQTINDLQSRLESEKRAAAEAAEAAQIRLRKLESANTGLQAHLDAAARSMKEAAENSAIQVTKLEETIRELNDRVARAEQAALRAPEQAALIAPAEVIPVVAVKEATEPAISQPARPTPKSLPVAETELQTKPLFHEPPPQAEVLFAAEAPAVDKTVIPSRRKKSRREETMDLFGENTSPPAVTEPAVVPSAPVEAPTVEPTQMEPPAQPIPEAAKPVDTTPAPPPPMAEMPGDDPTSADDDFPKIEGLNVSAVMARGAVSSVTYIKLVRQFLEQEAQAPERVRDALVLGNTEAAEQTLNSLKTGAEAIGALTVQAAAARLLHAIHDKTDPTEIEFLWADLHKALQDLMAAIKSAIKPKDDKPVSVRSQRTAQSVNPGQLRRAMHQILPLLAEKDPGAKDCFKDNRETFKPAFPPDVFAEFEQFIKKSDFDPALEHLRKAAKKHGISL